MLPQLIKNALHMQWTGRVKRSFTSCQYLHSIGKRMYNKKANNNASEYGRLDIVKCYTQLIKILYAMDWASEKGHLQVVKYLHSIGKEMYNKTN
jgi:hypothetical protein